MNSLKIKLYVDKDQIDDMGRDILKNFLNNTRNNLIDEFIQPTGRKGDYSLVYRGRLLQSITISDTLGVLKYKGKHAPYIEFGTNPHALPPKYKIEQWVRLKLGLRGKELERATFMIRRNITKKGTPRFEPMLHALQKTLHDPNGLKQK